MRSNLCLRLSRAVAPGPASLSQPCGRHEQAADAPQYRSVAAHKLLELDDRYDIFSSRRERNQGRKGASVAVDLAAAPGGFAQVAAERMLAGGVDDPLVIAFDLQVIRPLPHVISHRCSVINAKRIQSLVRQTLRSRHADGESSMSWPQVVLHDGVATGEGQGGLSVTYAQNNMSLCALKIAVDLFISAPASMKDGRGGPGGGGNFLRQKVCFVTKAMHSVHYNHILTATRRFFADVDAWKPPSSRPDSREIYIVGKSLRPSARTDFHNLKLTNASNITRDEMLSPFSLPPRPEDLHSVERRSSGWSESSSAGGKGVVWMCHQCEQMRSGCSPCFRCHPHRRLQ